MKTRKTPADITDDWNDDNDRSPEVHIFIFGAMTNGGKDCTLINCALHPKRARRKGLLLRNKTWGFALLSLIGFSLFSLLRIPRAIVSPPALSNDDKDDQIMPPTNDAKHHVISISTGGKSKTVEGAIGIEKRHVNLQPKASWNASNGEKVSTHRSQQQDAVESKQILPVLKNRNPIVTRKRPVVELETKRGPKKADGTEKHASVRIPETSPTKSKQSSHLPRSGTTDLTTDRVNPNVNGLANASMNAGVRLNANLNRTSAFVPVHNTGQHHSIRSRTDHQSQNTTVVKPMAAHPSQSVVLRQSKVCLPTDSAALAQRRFPRYRTAEFSQRCCWATPPAQPRSKNCTILVRPNPIRNNEGISWWVSEIVEAHLMTRSTGCRLLFDYGSRVNVHEVLSPWDDDNAEKWSVPSGFRCNSSGQDKCFLLDMPWSAQSTSGKFYASLGKKRIRMPQYRFAYFAGLHSAMASDLLHIDDYRPVTDAIPGFDLQTGFSCSLESLFHLAPGAAQYEPNLFNRILPTLRDERNLVIALYVRTGQTDSVANAERQGKATGADFTHLARMRAKHVLECALLLESEHLSKGNNQDQQSQVDFDRIVWMVATDTPGLKQWIIDAYNGNNANAAVPPDQQRDPSRAIPREVLTTGSRGTHTRAKREGNLKTADFAEALIDWYLIGESDVVISDGSMSFGETAALRTNRPLYMFPGGKRAPCSRVNLIHGNKPPTRAPPVQEKESASGAVKGPKSVKVVLQSADDAVILHAKDGPTHLNADN